MDNDGGRNSGNEQDTGKKICHRRHTSQQIQRLEAYFEECPHPNESQRQQLSQELNLEASQIKFWFQNKRTQSKAKDDKYNNMLLRGENEQLRSENEAMLEALQKLLRTDRGAPPFGREDLQQLRLENARLKEEREKRPIVGESSASVPSQPIFEPSSSLGPPASQTIQQQPLSQMDISLLNETAAGAVEELKRLLFTEEQFWVKSSIDGTYVIDSQRYETYSHGLKHFRSTSAHVESSKAATVVPIEATNLIEMFLDSEKWEELFPTIVSKAKTILVLGSERPVRENCNVVQVIWEQLHILSPLVPPREFTMVRCCQEIGNGLWIIAEVSHNVLDFDFVKASCYKRPSGCLIQTMPNAQSKVTWIEHVEIDHKLDAHKINRELLSGGLGYGAGRWIVALEKICERMALSSNLTLPASDRSEVIATEEGRRSVMKLGERMVKIFNEMLAMSGIVDFPQQSISGVRVSIRMNQVAGQPSGLVVVAASSLSIPLTPLQVYSFLQNLDTRPQWDVLSRGTVVSEISRTVTGSSETNCLTILQPMQKDSNVENNLVMLQDGYIDAVGGMIVYAPMDIATMKHAVSGREDPSHLEILPSGFIISSDGRRSTAEDGGTLLTMALQILVSSKTDRSIEEKEKSVNRVKALISSTVQKIKGLLNCPQ